MAKRRVNKNLVASITVAGVVLAVIVVAIATYNASRRDPAVIALKAKAQEAGDPRRAIDLYTRAFGEGKDAKYLLEAARVAREMGDLNTMFGLLNYAYTQSPDDPVVLNALLVRYWEIRDFFMGQWKDVQERAAKLCKQEPENLLALASLAEALEWLKDDQAIDDDRGAIGEALEWLTLEDASLADLADQILARAGQIDPTSSHVALVRAKQSLLRSGERVREAVRRGQLAEVEGIMQQARAEQVEYLRPALEAHPDEVPLRVACAQALVESGQWTAGRELLEAGIESQADDPDLHHELARVYLREIRQRLQDAAGEARAGAEEGAIDEELLALAEDAARASVDQALVAEGLRHANRAIELEPALYAAYMVGADLQRLGWMGDGSWKENPSGRQRAILESHVEALRETVGLESFRAMLAGFRLERLQLISAGFERALSFHRAAADDETRSQALTYMRGFLQEAQTQYPERPQTSLMEGYVALIDQHQRLALKAFSLAEEQAGRVGGIAAPLARLAREELSKLYRMRGELGLALDYTVRVIEDYQRQQQTPPVWLYLQQIEVLLSLNRPKDRQEALDLVEAITPQFPDWAPLKAVRARVLTALDRGDEAMGELDDLPTDDPRYMFERGRIAALNEDYDTAATLFGRILDAKPQDLPTIDRYLRVLIAAQRSDQALQFIRDRLETTTSEPVRSLLQSFDLLLSESDPEVRKQKRLEMIAANPDAYERAFEYFTFWRLQGESPRAVEYLDEMERLQQGDPQAQRLQFEMALRMGNCERAEKYATKLAQADADRMGGALFRGRYALSCGEASRALAEFRAAEREFPRDSQLKTYIAQALMRLSPPRYDQAIGALTEAVQYDPQSFDAQKLLYACYEMTGGRSEQAAVDALAAAVELAARLRLKDEYIEAHAQYLEEEKHPRQGIENREKLREQNPQDVVNLLRLAELYKKVADSESELNRREEAQRNYGLAQERLQAAAEAEPTDSRVARFAARFFAQRNDRKAGEQLLQRHLEAQEGLGEIVARGLLGRFYEMLADREVVLAREWITAGERREADPHRQAANNLRTLALSAYQQAQERVSEALAGGSEEDRRRAIIASASGLADFHRRTGRWEEMIEACRVILGTLDPDDSASNRLFRLSIVRGLRSLQRLGEARDELDAYRREFPSDLSGMRVEAELLIAGDELEQARGVLSRVLAVDPADAWSLYTRARIDVQRQRYTEARDGLLRAKDLAPQSFGLDHRFELARLYELMNKPELAEAELREMLLLDRKGGRDVELRLIALWKKTDQIQKAQTFVNELITKNPKQPFWPYELGQLLMEREEYSAAVRPLRTAAELTNYTNARAVEDWLRALVGARRGREAIGAYEGLPPGVLTPSIKAYAAEAYLTESRRDIAVLLLEQALGEASLHGVYEVRDVTHRAQALLGREDARALLRSVLDRASEAEAQLALRIMLAEFMVSDPDPAQQAGALPEIGAVLSEVPQGTELHLETLLAQALALGQAGKPEQAVTVYEQALELRATDIRALNNLAYLLADELERPAEALPYARKLHQVAPSGSVNVLDTVGWVYFKNGETEQALPVFLEAARIDPKHVAVRYHLGLVYVDRERRAEAEREFRRVLDLAREQHNADYAQKAEEALAKLR
ncbi:MAG: tetratricopeptide repeat protein [Planctomycetes bacterium]|nr:tetratricopeptide repeat protein [Planctomycetota bacterium]